MSTLSMNKDVLQEEDIFAQSQLQHANHNGYNKNNYSGGDSDLLGMSQTRQTSNINSHSTNNSNFTSQSQVGMNQNKGGGDNDLLGLSASSSMTSLSATNHSNVSNCNSNNPATNELLELSYHYEAPKPLPTADLLGFSVDNDNSNDDPRDPSNKHNQLPQSSTSNNELLSLEYNVNEIENPFQTETAMKINDAYVALEQMRVANLEIEFGHNIDTQKCVQCIRQTPSDQIRKKYGVSSSIFSGKSFRFKNDKPCMMCGSPTCKKHSDPNFLKSKIVICTECSPLFSLDFIIECVCLNIAAEGDDDDDNDDDDDDNNDNGSNMQEEQKNDQGVSDEDNNGKYEQSNAAASNDTTGSQQSQSAAAAAPQPKRIFQPKNSIPLSPKEQLRRRNIKHMVDVYDRIHLMLTYSAQFIDEIAAKLETNTRREDQLGLSSNSIGIASGLAGIAAAAAVVTPAGPPLIVASLLFGATAQASSSGSKLVNYYSAPNKVALKIISYYNLLKSILVVTNVLKDALMEDNIDVEQYVSHKVKTHDEAMIQLNLSREEEDEDGEDGGGNDTKDTNSQKHENKSGSKPNDDIEFEDDWETDDDSTAVSMRSKSSMATMSNTLSGIKENQQYTADDDGFGDFQKADSIDTNSILSPNNELSPTETKFTFSPTSEALDDLSNNPNEPMPSVPTMKKSPDGDNVNATVPVPYPTDDKDKDSKTKTPTEDLMERQDTAGKLARFYSRTSLAGTSLVGAATVTVFAGAALSLAHVAFEANNFASTIKRLQAGSPSKRAKVLRAIKRDILNIPNTSVIAEEWDKYLIVLDDRRKNNMKQENDS